MHALPAAPAGPKHRQIIVGTALASAAALSLFMGMIVTWLRMRDQTRAAGSAWVPEDTAVPMVAAHVMLLVTGEDTADAVRIRTSRASA